MIHLLFLLTADGGSMDKWLAGQAGFALATILGGIFYWKVIMPARAKETEAIMKITDSVNALAIITKQALDGKLDKILDKLPNSSHADHARSHSYEEPKNTGH